MAIVGIGTDLVDVARVQKLVEGSPKRVQQRLYTGHEWDYAHTFKDPYPSLAARFAAKEAGFKALRISTWQGFSWKEIEVVSGEGRIPSIVYHDGAKDILLSKGVTQAHISVAHLKTHAVATVILEA